MTKQDILDIRKDITDAFLDVALTEGSTNVVFLSQIPKESNIYKQNPNKN
jgi:hypothetical protein